MGRSKTNKAARKLAGQIAKGAPAFLPLRPLWTERLPFVGRWLRARRERRDVIRLQLHLESIKYARKRVSRVVAKNV